MRRVEFLGHDDEGNAVFRDCEYPSDGPRTTDGKGSSTWDSPDVFRMSKEMAREHYGSDYMTSCAEVPHWPQARDVLKREWNEASTRPRNEALEKHGAEIEAEVMERLSGREDDMDMDR
jgi:hypothetical protein